MKRIKLFEQYSEGPETIVYIHGLDSVPGPKYEWLESNYHHVYAPSLDYRRDPDRVFDQLIRDTRGMNVSLVVGSSMGGYMAYWLCRQIGAPGLLFNPALASRSLDVSVRQDGRYSPTFDVVLGDLDNVVNPDDTRRWLTANRIDCNVHEERIGHKIPMDVFTKYVRLCTGTHGPLDEKSGEILHTKKNQWVRIDPKDHAELSNELYDLISTAYVDIGGHSKINSPDDVFSDPDWTFWKGVDLHDSPDVDLVVWGQDTKYGVKFSGVGHDGEKDTKRAYLEQKAKDLSKIGYYNEVSGKLAQIMVNKYGVPVVEDEETVKKLIPKMTEFHGGHPTDPTMPGKGWYTRMIGGHPHVKLVIGRPKNV